MKCSIASCGLCHSKKRPHLTFHRLPRNETRRNNWLQMIGDNIRPGTKEIFVCSLHFDVSAFNKTLNVLRLKDDAVPTLFKKAVQPSDKKSPVDDPCISMVCYNQPPIPSNVTIPPPQPTLTLELDMRDPLKARTERAGLNLRRVLTVHRPKPPKLEYCRVCLTVASRMYDLELYGLTRSFEEMSSLSINDSPEVPGTLCVECTQRLINFEKFRKRTRTAHQLLLEVIKMTKRSRQELTKDTLRQLILRNASLKSELVTEHFEPNFYDLVIEENEMRPKEETTFLTDITDKDYNDEDLSAEFLEDDSNDSTLSAEYLVEDDGKNGDLSAVFLVDRKDEDLSPEYLVDDHKDEDLSPEFLEDDSNDENDNTTNGKVDDTVKKAEIKPRKRKTDSETDSNTENVERKLPTDLDEKIILKTLMSADERISEHMKRREWGRYKRSFYKCDICYKGFKDDATHTFHMVKHTDQHGLHECDVCKIRFRLRKEMKKHVAWGHKYKYACQLCAFVCYNRTNAVLHQDFHKGKTYRCELCDEIFYKCTTWKSHVRIKHPSGHVCPLCGLEFVSPVGVKQHVTLKHWAETTVPPDSPHWCESCDIRFMSEEALQRHKRVSLKHPELHLQNDSSVIKPTTLSSNKRASKMIACEQKLCGVILRLGFEYFNHFRRAHPDSTRSEYSHLRTPCQCEYCGKIFGNQTLLLDHTFMHRDGKNFKCDVCQKSFKTKHRVAVHKHLAHRKHNRMYECNVCKKSFAHYANRSRHMVIHSGVRAHQCEVCGYCYRYEVQLRDHTRHVHLKQPWPKRNRTRKRPQP